jgi:hypothetical protein
MYARGDGVPRDYPMAAEWLRKAAEQGHAIAQFNLGEVYANGHGVPKDLTEAHAWYQVAVATGSKDAVKARERLEKKMTRAQISEANKLAGARLEKFGRNNAPSETIATGQERVLP